MIEQANKAALGLIAAEVDPPRRIEQLQVAHVGASCMRNCTGCSTVI
jgi:hypothetical protein